VEEESIEENKEEVYTVRIDTDRFVISEDDQSSHPSIMRPISDTNFSKLDSAGAFQKSV